MTTEIFKKIPKKKSNFDFYIQYIKELVEDGKYLMQIPNFPWSNNNYFYTKKDNKGWWMVTKQIGIRYYDEGYLNIWGNKQNFKLYYIDPLSSWGMNRVTKNHGNDQFIFPGTSVKAALVSEKNKRGFDEFFLNDLNPKKREILIKRFTVYNNSIKKSLKFNIEPPEKKNIDSNIWIKKVLNDITRRGNRFINYLMVIDNEGMDISYNTLKYIRDKCRFGDLIITFQDSLIARAIHKVTAIKNFFGTNVDESIKSTELCKIYIEQLSNIGLDKIETLPIRTKTGFHYTLLFCCREGVSAEWLTPMIEKLRDERFRSWNDRNVQQFWNIVKGKNTTFDGTNTILDKWLRKKRFN